MVLIMCLSVFMSILNIGFCLVKSRPGVFNRAKSPFIEMETNKGDSYTVFATKASGTQVEQEKVPFPF